MTAPSPVRLGLETFDVGEFERVAFERLPRAAVDFIVGGSGRESTLQRNRDDLRRHRFAPRMLVDVREVDLTTSVGGARWDVPFFVAPSGSHRLVHPDAELATAAGAARAGVPFTTSSAASVSLEEVADVAPDERWFQLYCFKDRGIVRDLVKRAEESRYRALVLTVDAPVLGNRLRDRRNGFSVGPEIRWANLEPYGNASLSASRDGSVVAQFFADQIDAGLTWADVEWLVAITDLPVMVKGLLRADDAKQAARLGVGGVYVSNHGGRQLDRAPSTIEALPAIVDAVRATAPEIPVLIDGGFEDAEDVAVALALGAQAVGFGRLPVLALAAGGASGVEALLKHLRTDLQRCLQLLGVPSVGRLGPESLMSWKDISR